MTRLAASAVLGYLAYGLAVRIGNETTQRRVLGAWSATLERDLTRSGRWA